MYETSGGGSGLSEDRRLDDPWVGDGDFDDLCWRLTCEALDGNSGEPPSGLEWLDAVSPGPVLGLILSAVARTKLNGYDLVWLLKARERMVSHYQAETAADMVEIAYAAPGDADTPPARCEEAFEFASDEVRAALTLTRRSAENRMVLAFDLVERLPRVWKMLNTGAIDLPRARVLIDGTSHLDEQAARRVVDALSDVAPFLTTGELRSRIRKLCVTADPEDAEDQYRTALEQRLLWVEPTIYGTANVHLLDIPLADATAIGRRVNAHMISLKNDGDTRSHDQLRADIACDLLLGADPTNGGRGLVDIRVDLTTLAGLDENAAEIPGVGPVIADVARQVADQQHRAEWRATVTDDDGRIVDIVTTRRRPTAQLARHVEAHHPTCSFPGCRISARDCDLDHYLPWKDGGPTSLTNTGPKCRHDHILKDHGWTHVHRNGQDIWTSPLGHTYITQGQSP
ncbi:MAG: DUF222 domain-containing protein [Acidimicrobiia bacterium]